MSNNLHQAIQELLDHGQVPARVSNRLLLAMLLEIAQRQVTLEERLTERTEAEARLERRVSELEQYPSLTHHLRYHPKRTILTVIVLFVLLMSAYTAGILPVVQALAATP